MKGIYFNLQWP